MASYGELLNCVSPVRSRVTVLVVLFDERRARELFALFGIGLGQLR